MQSNDFPQLASIETIQEGFESYGYICSEKIATAVFLAFQLRKPVLVEGPPGVGKTELASRGSSRCQSQLEVGNPCRHTSSRPLPCCWNRR